MEFAISSIATAGYRLIPYFKEHLNDNAWLSAQDVHKLGDKAGDGGIYGAPEDQSWVHYLCLGEEVSLQSAHKIIRKWMIGNASSLPDTIAVDLTHMSTPIIFQIVLGLELADYNMGDLKSEVELTAVSKAELLVISADQSAEEMIQEASLTAQAMKSAMKLVDTPSNIKTPQYLAKWAHESSKQHQYRVEVLSKEALDKEGLEALLAVGQGSEHPPVLIKMEYRPLKDQDWHLGLVGKGVTFDTGGVSLKKPLNMHYMKSDMGGAAAVMCAIELIARLALPINVVAVVPVAENTLDARSIKPGDVIGSYSKKSIEIIDTDAEGRLILADALSYLHKHYNPKSVVDLATLTGSCVATLGYHAAGVFTNSDELFDQLQKAGEHAHEKIWRLPLWEAYEEDLHSDVADIRNFSGKPLAGAITAAKFLEFFIKDHPNWAHLDIAGVAFGNTDHAKMKSATGFGVRLIAEYAKLLRES
ncbi:MAG: leucyl aminopeptidase family protein [Cyclobacteriaceae bacterium]|nr:leucyl aminopeptidase family protein [Cyclobacteriaceae bacterium]